MAKAIKGTAKYCKGNVMTPINWFGGAFVLVLIHTGASQHANWYGVVCFILATLVFLAYLSIYIYFIVKNPDRLQSEQFNLERQALLINNDISLSSGGSSVTIDQTTKGE